MDSLAQVLEETIEKEEMLKEPKTLEEFMDGVEDEVRYLVRTLIQTYVEDEFRRYIGAGPYERSEERRDWRNGYQRPKDVGTRFGVVPDILIPRSRKNGFISSILSRWQRKEKKIARIVREMFIRGVSTRKIRRLSKILWGEEISASQVSVMNKAVKEELLKWLNRPIKKKFAYLFLDGINLKIRRQVISKESLLCVVGVTEDGAKEFLGFLLGGRESAQAWESTLLHFIKRGLDPCCVKLVISDGCPGMIKAIKEFFPEANHQRCLYHKMRNLANKCPNSEWPVVKAKLNKIYFAPTQMEARTIKDEFVQEFERILPRVVQCLKKDFENCIAHKNHPYRRWSHIRTTNLIERTFKEFRRRVKVMETFPNEASCIRIMFSLAKLQNENWEGKPFKNF